jgi:type I restriction enzyme S subunit
VAEGDILVPKITPTFQADRTAIATPIAGGVAAATTEVHVVRVKPAVDRRYVRYLLSTKQFLDEGEAAMIGVAGQKRVPDELLRDLYVPTLDRSRQVAIADYLDSRLAQIESLVTSKRRIVLLLREAGYQRQALLAVGACSGVELCDSGHAWLGGIPRHWEVKRLKFIARIESGHTPSRTQPELWENCTLPWITLNDVGYLERHEYIEEPTNLISVEGLAASSARVLPAGTVVLSRDATIGRCGIMARPMATSQHFAAWVCGPTLRPRYLWLLLHTAMQAHLASLTDGATLRTIGMPDIKQLVVPVPPIDEQDTIVEVAERVRTSMDRAIDRLKRQIVLLQERRRALITAAITGQVPIPGVAA